MATAASRSPGRLGAVGPLSEQRLTYADAYRRAAPAPERLSKLATNPAMPNHWPSDRTVRHWDSEERGVRAESPKVGAQSKVTCQFVADKEKDSHGRLYFGDEFNTLKDRKKEIGRDLLAKMCADLKIDPHDL